MLWRTTFEIDEAYTPIKAIGKGAYGVVCSAKHKDDKVAIKKIGARGGGAGWMQGHGTGERGHAHARMQLALQACGLLRPRAAGARRGC